MTAPDPVWTWACPVCRALLVQNRAGAQCGACRQIYPLQEGIWRFLTDDQRRARGQFMVDYRAVRRAESWGATDAAYYRALPRTCRRDPRRVHWRMRAKTLQAFVRQVLPALAAADGEPLKIADVGAGNGWMSNRLALLGHHPCAVDLSDDDLDGLGAARHYASRWPCVQAEFDRLPLASAEADLAVFNASFHYSREYTVTLQEALRVLRPAGAVVIIDSPVYPDAASGERMMAERRAAFARDLGVEVEPGTHIGYLTWGMLRELERDVGIRWHTVRPWHGMRRALRPWLARITHRRAPGQFMILVGSMANRM